MAVLVTRLTNKSRGGRTHILTWSRSSSSNPQPTPVSQPQANSKSTIAPTPSVAPGADGASSTSTPLQNLSSPVPPPGNLIVPVAGVRPDQLRDTFSEARSEGRVHDAIDIPAAHGTPVIATADGTILKLFQSERGGTTIYQLSTDSKYVYYYAHLDRYAEGLAAGHFARQGETIAYVGDTGNAVAGNYHLHFSVALIADPKRYWEGTNINPYPLLRR
jgi:murein DD-endopeptidase MepM/ murein hydrolase activator NlpD